MIVCVRNKYIQKDRAKHTKNIHNNNFSIKSNEHLASSKPPLSCHWEPFCPSELFDKCFLSCNICKWWSNNCLTISCVCVIAPQSACKPHSDCVNQQRARYVWNGFLRKRISLSLSIWNRKRPTVIRPAITNHQPIKNLCLVFLVHSLCLSNANGLVVVFFCSLHNWQFNQFVISFHPVKRQRLIIRTVPRRFANDRCAWFGTHTPHTWLSSMISSSALSLWFFISFIVYASLVNKSRCPRKS